MVGEMVKLIDFYEFDRLFVSLVQQQNCHQCSRETTIPETASRNGHASGCGTTTARRTSDASTSARASMERATITDTASCGHAFVARRKARMME